MSRTPNILGNRGQRVAAAISSSPHSQADVARHLGISRQALTDIVKGRAPGEKHLGPIAALTAVPESWLRDGGDPPRQVAESCSSSVLPSTPEVMAFLSFARDGFAAYRKLPAAERERLLGKCPAALRTHIARQGGPPGPMTLSLSAFVACFRLVNVDIADFGAANVEEGFQAIRASLDARREILSKTEVQDEGPDLALPPAIFATVRGALLTLRGERRTFNRNPTEVDDALAEVWRRQLTRRWNVDARARLETERTADIGPEDG